jgi:23S rRNA (guanosine2251-2'-O)-methyltransferase
MELLIRLHPIREALRARRRSLVRLRVRDPLPKDAAEVLALAEAAGVPVERQPPADLERGLPPGGRSQGFVLEAHALPTLSLEELMSRGRAGDRAFVCLDGVEDPQNLGALARATDASGADGLILSDRHAPPLSAAVSQASAGAIEHLPVARVPNLGRALDQLKQHGFWVLGADSEAPQALFDTPDRLWEGDLVVVLGAEGRGLRPGVARRLDHRLRIPMRGKVASLNVASAGAVLLFEAQRRRVGSGEDRGPSQRPDPPRGSSA